MAHPANRSIDFAPAWLKLQTEQPQVQKRHVVDNNNPNSRSSNVSHHSSASNGCNQSHSNQLSRDFNFHSFSTNSSGDRFSSHYHPQHHHHTSQQPNTSAAAASSRHGRQSLSNYSPRTPVTHAQQGLLRSQSTGSYTDNGNRAIAGGVPASDPLEEDFPLLSGGPSIAVSKQKTLANTVQWRVKPTVGDHLKSKEENSEIQCQNDEKNLLANKQPGKVYRAQVRPVRRRRSNVIPIGNGGGNTVPRQDQNGHVDHSSLSSSVEKEKRLLQEMGWKEEDDSEDDCVIPEQDPVQLQEIMMQAKAARERLLMKSKHTLKPMSAVTAAVTLPNDDEICSSSDNSDAE